MTAWTRKSPGIMRSAVLGALLILPAAGAWASNVFIVVSENKSKACRVRKDDPDVVQYLLTVQETEKALDNYLHGRSNPELYGAVFVNAGLKFCGRKEKQAIVAYLIKSLDAEKTGEGIYGVILNYSNGKMMLEEIARSLARKDISPSYRAHLTKAKTQILKLRKS